MTYSKQVQTSENWDDDPDEVVYKGEDLELLRKSIRQELEEEMSNKGPRKKRESEITNYGGKDGQTLDNVVISMAEEGEIDAKLAEIAESSKKPLEEYKKTVSERQMDYITNEIMVDKLFKRLKELNPSK